MRTRARCSACRRDASSTGTPPRKSPPAAQVAIDVIGMFAPSLNNVGADAGVVSLRRPVSRTTRGCAWFARSPRLSAGVKVRELVQTFGEMSRAGLEEGSGVVRWPVLGPTKVWAAASSASSARVEARGRATSPESSVLRWTA